jgi:hypothetical protein
MRNTFLRFLFCGCASVMILLLIACNGGGSSPGGGNGGGNNPQTGTANIVISDDPTEDWSMVGVKVLSISVTPKGGGTPVTVYTAPTPTPISNLVQLNQIGELLSSANIPVGTYTSATLTLSANPGDVLLIASPDPEAGFAAAPGTTVPSNQIQLIGAKGNAGSLTVPLSVNFVSPLTVTANQSNALDLEFVLGHPACIVPHVPVGGGTVLWAVNFAPAFVQQPVPDITRLTLRHLLATVTSVASNHASIAVTRDFLVEPRTNPETAIPSTQNLTILADATNGTTFFDVDTNATSTIKDFATQAGTLSGRFVRVAGRFQSDGSFVAVRIWAGNSFNSVSLEPEGTVLNVNTSTNIITVTNEQGLSVPVTVNSATQFFQRTPGNGLADATPIGTGATFLTNVNRGFKVHVGSSAPLPTPLVAQTVEIETAAFSGSISAATTTGFTDARTFRTAVDDYTISLDFVSSNTPNGTDAAGNPIVGFKWLNFTLPSTINSGTTAISSFLSATLGSANFGGSAPIIGPFGNTYGLWNNPANPGHWSALSTVLVPAPTPLATVDINFVPNSTGGSFAITVPNGGLTPVTVNAVNTSGSATLFFQVDRTNGLLTVTPQDITTNTGLNNISAALVKPTLARVFGVPQNNGSILAFVVIYFTGTQPAA